MLAIPAIDLRDGHCVQLVVEAHRLGLTDEDVRRAMAKQWQHLKRERS